MSSSESESSSSLSSSSSSLSSSSLSSSSLSSSSLSSSSFAGQSWSPGREGARFNASDKASISACCSSKDFTAAAAGEPSAPPPIGSSFFPGARPSDPCPQLPASAAASSSSWGSSSERNRFIRTSSLPCTPCRAITPLAARLSTLLCVKGISTVMRTSSPSPSRAACAGICASPVSLPGRSAQPCLAKASANNAAQPRAGLAKRRWALSPPAVDSSKGKEPAVFPFAP